MKNNSRNRKHLKHWKHSRIGKMRARSVLHQAVKVAAQGALIGTLLTPTTVLPLQARIEQSLAFTVGEWMPPVEHHGEPRHAMGGMTQQAMTSTSSGTIIGYTFTVDFPTPMAEYFLVQRAADTMDYHHHSSRDAATFVLGQVIRTPRPPDRSVA